MSRNAAAVFSPLSSICCIIESLSDSSPEKCVPDPDKFVTVITRAEDIMADNRSKSEDAARGRVLLLP